MVVNLERWMRALSASDGKGSKEKEEREKRVKKKTRNVMASRKMGMEYKVVCVRLWCASAAGRLCGVSDIRASSKAFLRDSTPSSFVNSSLLFIIEFDFFAALSRQRLGIAS